MLATAFNYPLVIGIAGAGCGKLRQFHRSFTV